MKRKKISLKMPSGYSFGIHAAVILLNLFGFLMILSANMTSTADRASLTVVAIKEITFIIISYVGMVWIARNFSFKSFHKNYNKILGGLAILLIATMFFGSVNGSKAWIRLGFVTIQPSEFAKIIVILVMANSIADKHRLGAKYKKVWPLIQHPLFVVALIVGFVLVVQSDLGSAVVIAGIAYIITLVPSNQSLSKMQKIMFFLLFVGLSAIFLVTTPKGIVMIEKLPIPDYMIDRFRISANPFSNRYDYGYYQIYNGIVAIVKGGIFGLGYGKGFIKYSYLPESQNDAILAVVVEEFGAVGFIVILILYGFIIYRLLEYAFKVKSEKEKMVLIGTVAYIMIHFVFNIGGITALIPLTGVPLLFLSAGGSSRLAIMMAIGLSQNVIARQRSSERRLENK